MPSVDRELATKINQLEEERLNLAFLLENDLPEEYRVVLQGLLKSVTQELARLAGPEYCKRILG